MPGRVYPSPLYTLLAALAFAACSAANTYEPPGDGRVPRGTWGGDSAGFIVGDTAAHLHIACTYGDIPGRIALSPSGTFDVTGNYMLRAYPIAVGPSLPARFVGRMEGARLIVTVTVNDTVMKTTVVRGPVTVQLGAAPSVGNCPICQRPDLAGPSRVPGDAVKQH